MDVTKAAADLRSSASPMLYTSNPIPRRNSVVATQFRRLASFMLGTVGVRFAGSPSPTSEACHLWIPCKFRLFVETFN